MSVRRLQSVEGDSQNGVRRVGRIRRRNGLANILSGLSSEEVENLRSLGNNNSSSQMSHPARRGSTGTTTIPAELLENLTLQRRRSVTVEIGLTTESSGSAASILSGNNGDSSGDSLMVPQQDTLRLSPASSLRALEEGAANHSGQNGDSEVCRSHIPTSNYLRQRRNAVSYVNPTQFFLDTLVAKASTQ